jgi:hypothetical protein
MRTRLLRPGFFENEELAALPPHARLLFEGLWLMADRAGRLKDRPPVIRATLFAYEPDVDVNKLLTALARAGFIRRYVGAKRVKCLEVINFKLHQNPHHREPETALPEPRKSRGSASEKPRPSRPDTCTDTDTGPDTYKPAASRPVHSPPFKVYAAIAARVLTQTADLDLDPATLTEELKREFAKAEIPYDATLVGKALEAAQYVLAKRRA